LQLKKVCFLYYWSGLLYYYVPYSATSSA
jgi:hypothetical protein